MTSCGSGGAAPSGARGSAPDSGFTLIEIIAAVVIFGFLIAGLAQGVRFGLTAWRLQTQTVARDTDLDVATRTLTRLLTAIAPVGPADPPSVVGTARELAFTTTLPVRIGTPATDLADARLADDGGKLVLDLVPHLHAQRLVPAPKPTRIVLATGLDALAIDYWRRSDSRWLTTWKGTEPPQLVRVTISLSGGRHWAPVVAAPNLSRYDQ